MNNSVKRLLKLASRLESKLAHQDPALPPPPATPASEYWGEGSQWHTDARYGKYNPKAPPPQPNDTYYGNYPANYNPKDEVVGWHKHPYGNWYAEPAEDPNNES